jgi:hypothetical protein
VRLIVDMRPQNAFLRALLVLLALSSQPTRAIEGGYDATDIADAPWHVNFIVAEGYFREGASFCGGAVLGDRWVLTAASCFSSSSITEEAGFKLVVGSINQGGDGGVVIEPSQTIVHVHPLFEYFYTSVDVLPHDVALVELVSPISCIDGIDNDGDGDTDSADADCLTGSEGDGVPVIPLPLDQTASWPETSATVQMMGYGDVSGPNRDVLRLATAAVIRASPPATDGLNYSCDEVYGTSPSYSSQRNFCAGGNRDSPIGHHYDDVGGPLVAEFDGVQVLAGIASRGTEVVGFSNFTRVTPILDFIGTTAPELLNGRPATPVLQLSSQSGGEIVLTIQPNSHPDSPAADFYTTTCEVLAPVLDSGARASGVAAGLEQLLLGRPLDSSIDSQTSKIDSGVQPPRRYSPNKDLLRAKNGERLWFIDPRGARYPADIVSTQSLQSGNYLIKAQRGETFILAVINSSGNFTATVFQGGRRFQASILGGQTIIQELGEDTPEPADYRVSDIVSSDGERGRQGSAQSFDRTMKAEQTCGEATRTAVISVGIVYDDAIASSMDASAEIDLLIAETNLVYQQSGVDIRFDLVGSLNYQPEDTSFWNVGAYQQSPEVDQWRQEVKPDLVHILKKEDDGVTTGVCGYAYLPSYEGGGLRFSPWGTTKLGATSINGIYYRECANAMQHEIGHNLGLQHDIEASIWRSAEGYASPGVFSSYGRGHGWEIFTHPLGYEQAGRGTLMAYSTLQFALLSNPELQEEGVALGIPAGQPREANAAQAVRDIMCYAEKIADNGSIAFHPLFTRADGEGEITPDFDVQDKNQASVSIISPSGSAVAVSGCEGIYHDPDYVTAPLVNACAVRAQFFEPLQQSSETTLTFQLPEGFDFSCKTVASNSQGDAPASYALEVTTPSIPPAEVSPVALSGGAISPSLPVMVDVDQGFEFNVVPDEGYLASGVTGNCDTELLENRLIAIPSREDCSFAVSFSQAIEVTVSAGEGGEVSPDSPRTIPSGSGVAFQVAPLWGYRTSPDVGGNCPPGAWSGDQYIIDSVQSPCAISFLFEPDPVAVYALVAQWNAGGSVYYDSSVYHGDLGRLNIIPDEGFDLMEVRGDCPAGQFLEAYPGRYRYQTGPIQTHCSLEVKFGVPPFFTVTSSASAGGAIDPSGAQVVEANSAQNYELNPLSGYTLSSVGGTCRYGSLSGNSYTSGAITADCSVIAAFALLPPTAPPPTPQILSVEAGDEEIIISVAATKDATSYLATCSGPDGTFTKRSNKTTIVVNGPRNGESYVCNVVAENSVGSSEPSTQVSVTPEMAPSGLPIWLLYQATQ